MHQIIYHLPNGRPYPSAPFVTCIKGVGNLRYEDILSLVGLQKAQRNNGVELSGMLQFKIFVCRSDDWIILLDNWGYDFYHIMMLERKNGGSQVDKLGEKYEMFQGVFGDSDKSFAYYYFRDGVLSRKVEVEDPHYRGPELGETYGEPMPGEETYFNLQKDYPTIINLAWELGIRFPEELDRYQQYTYEPPEAAIEAYWWMRK